MNKNFGYYIFSENDDFNDKLIKEWDFDSSKIKIFSSFDLLEKDLEFLSKDMILVFLYDKKSKDIIKQLNEKFPTLFYIFLIDKNDVLEDSIHFNPNVLQIINLPIEIQNLQKIIERCKYYLELQELFECIHYDKVNPILSLEGFYNKAMPKILINPTIDYDLFLTSIRDFDELVLSSTHDEENTFLDLFISLLNKFAIKYEGLVANAFEEYFLLLIPTKARALVLEKLSKKLKERFIFESVKLDIGLKQIDLESSTLREEVEKVSFALRKCREEKSNSAKNVNYFVYQQVDLDLIERNEVIVDTLIRAIKEEEFSLLFKPTYDIQNHTIIASEVDLVWHHPIFGIISSQEYVPALERKKHIALFDLFVVEKICQIIVSYQEKDIKMVPFVVNLSMMDFEVDDFVLNLVNIVKKYHINPELIVLCLKEPKHSYDFKLLKKYVPILRKNKFRLGIDGFVFSLANASVSGLLAIDNLRLNMLLDRYNCSFYERMTLLRVALAVSKELGFEVVVTGVQNAQTMSDVSITDCKYAQGEFFSPPLKIEKLLDMINN